MLERQLQHEFLWIMLSECLMRYSTSLCAIIGVEVVIVLCKAS